MARPLRIEYPGAYYHVMSRGNSRQDIFLTDKDRLTFLEGLGDSCEIYAVRCVAYVLMANHFHFILQTSQPNLSEFMRHLLVTYTVRFNRKHGRSGHVFQGRYKSLLVEEDKYLLPLSRYIHLNPIRTREFEDTDYHAKAEYLKKYRWSTLPGYCYVRKRNKKIDYTWLLGVYFGGDKPQGRRRYREYVFGGMLGQIENPFDDVVHQCVLGTEDFVDWVKKKLSWEKQREVPSLRKLRRSIPIEDIIENVSAAFGVEPTLILTPNRKLSTLRRMAMELCYRYSAKNQREIGEIFGVDYSTISLNRKRLSTKLKSDRKLRKQFDKAEQQIALLSK
ncbi:MAG: transposase [Deltaproteobacteria bacterium]|nr:transposase [Deltaproteobacteria bacterium]